MDSSTEDMERQRPAAPSGDPETSGEAFQQDRSVAPSLVARVLQWGPVAVMAVTPLALLTRIVVPVADPDTFWHIVAGKYLSSNHQFGGDAPWPPAAKRPWLLHEWLPELWFAAADTVGGLRAVAFLQGVLALGLLLTLYICARRFARPLPATMVVLIAWLGVSAGVSARPQMVTFALLAITTTAWIRTAQDRRPRWWLVAMSYVWACSHGLWIAGVLVGAAVVFGMLLDRTCKPRELARLAAIPILSAVLGLFTPVGPGLLLATSEIGRTTKYVAEWSPASLQAPYLAATVGLAVVVAFVWARSATTVPWAHAAVWVLALTWALTYGRTVALGAVMLVPLTALALDIAVPTPLGSVPRHRERLVVGTGFGLALAASVVISMGVSPLPSGVPTGLDPELSDLPQGAVVFNEYALGGWLLYDHPNVAAVIDGRTELYGAEYVGNYMAALVAAPGWDRTVGATGAHHALLPDDSPLAAALQAQLHWTIAGHENGFLLLAAP